MERAQVRPTDMQRQQGLIPQVQSLGAAPRTSTLPGGALPSSACLRQSDSIRPCPGPKAECRLRSPELPPSHSQNPRPTGMDAERGRRARTAHLQARQGAATANGLSAERPGPALASPALPSLARSYPVLGGHREQANGTAEVRPTWVQMPTLPFPCSGTGQAPDPPQARVPYPLSGDCGQDQMSYWR